MPQVALNSGVDPETGYLKDAGDTRIKHAYALFAGSYVAPDKVTSKVNPDDPLKPVKKALPHADGLYRAIHVCPVIDLTQEFLDEAGLVIGGNKARAPRNIASSDGSVIRKIDPAKAYSSYGRRRFKYNLTAERIEALKANADPDYIRNKDGRTLDSISFTNQKVFSLIKPRDDYTSRGVTNDETESAENMALAYEMRKLGFDNPDTIAMAIILYQPREKNYEIRSNGISYLADTIAGAFDLYDLEQSDEFTEDEILAATNAGTEPSHIEIATGRGTPISTKSRKTIQTSGSRPGTSSHPCLRTPQTSPSGGVTPVRGSRGTPHSTSHSTSEVTTSHTVTRSSMASFRALWR